MPDASPSSSKGQNGTTATESTPLLGSSADDPEITINDSSIHNYSKLDDEGESISPPAQQQDDDKPLPRTQIFLLCFAAMVEPMAFFGILPFINKMIYDTGDIKESDVGFYAGLIESLFSLTQMTLMMGWSKASDRFGRKPVLIFSLGGVSIATAIFGLSTTIGQMVLFRCSAGVFAGTVVTIRTMLAEHSTPKTQARSFSFFAFARNLGILVGPAIGGALADPQEMYGGVFKKIAFLATYPYALSTLVNGLVGVGATIICGIFVKETLERTAKGGDAPATPPTMSTWELLKTPGVAIVLGLYAHAMLLGLTYSAISPTFWFTEPSLGGFGFTPIQITAFLAAIGISQALWLLLAFPYLQRRFSTGAILRVCYTLWPFFFLASPACNLLLRWGGKWRIVFWVVGPVLQCGGSGVSMAFTGVQLALNDIAPTHQTVNTLNGIALTMVSGTRAFAPAAFTSLFAIGVRTQIFNGYLAWVVLFLIALPGTIGVHWLPKKAEGRLAKSGDEEDEDVVR